MEWKSAAGLVIAFFAVFFVAILVAPTWHRSKDFQTISASHPLKMNRLSAEEINRRTLRLAATIKHSAK
jgi:biopolymer transport protein ExbB/TolQ